MEQVCLIVDDKDQQHTFKAQIQDILKKEGHNVEIIFINTTSPELLDKDKLKACIKSKIEGKHIDVVASDFDLSDDVVNGLDVIEIIRSIREKVPIILYSGNLEKAIKSVMGDPASKDLPTFINDVKKLMLHHISEFIDRTGYAASVIKVLKNKDTSTKQILLKKLREYPDLKLSSAYPIFSGKKLSQIADEIEKSTYQGQEFQQELIEQTIAYIIEIS